MKRSIIVALTFFFSIVQARGQQSEIFAPGGKAIKGYDAVAFFKQSKAVKGADSLSYQWKGANWLFASQGDLDAFKTTPEEYAPQYGGYCAYGVSQGHKAPTQTDTWSVVNDKLYFNYNVKVKEVWTKDEANFIQTADQKWPDLKNK
jgi:YHS domain-containing protein